jgi:hypothetical protein
MTVVKSKTNFYFFSLHAEDQLRSRSKMLKSDVIRIFENGLILPIGTDKHRTHVLIHSVIDDSPYVIIYDERNKEIVTFLYVDYHNKFVVFQDAIDKIKHETLNYKPRKNRNSKNNSPIKKETSPIEWIIPNASAKQIKDSGIADVYIVSQSKGTDGYIHDFVFKIDTTEFDNDIEKIKNYKFFKRIEDIRATRKIEKCDILNISIKERLTGHTIKLAASRHFMKYKKEDKS